MKLKFFTMALLGVFYFPVVQSGKKAQENERSEEEDSSEIELYNMFAPKKFEIKKKK